MPDPAVEAAQRALATMPLLTKSANEQAILKALLDDVMSAAAREALKPIRATYARWESAFGGSRGEVPEMVQVLLDELAPLIYTT